MNPVNELREVLFDIDQGLRGRFAIANKVNVCVVARKDWKS
jgi:hypothetical protein